MPANLSSRAGGRSEGAIARVRRAPQTRPGLRGQAEARRHLQVPDPGRCGRPWRNAAAMAGSQHDAGRGGRVNRMGVRARQCVHGNDLCVRRSAFARRVLRRPGCLRCMEQSPTGEGQGAGRRDSHHGQLGLRVGMHCGHLRRRHGRLVPTRGRWAAANGRGADACQRGADRRMLGPRRAGGPRSQAARCIGSAAAPAP